MSDLGRNPEDQFSRVVAQMKADSLESRKMFYLNLKMCYAHLVT